jgi:hypothetical protein
LKIFSAPSLIQSALQFLSAAFGGQPATPPLGSSSGSGALIIVPDAASEDGVSQVSNRVRQWRAYDQTVSDDSLISVVRKGFDALGRHYPHPINEATTRDLLIVPVLMVLDYYPWLAEFTDNGKIPDFKLSDRVALEIKKNKPAYGNISSANNNKKFATIAHQVVTYLDECGFETLLYSNGFFWWRIERELESQQLHALRFDMRLAYNEIANRRSAQHLARFRPLFHAKAFSPGNNYAVDIRQGLGQKVEPYDKVGLVWMKDINTGYVDAGL